MFREQTAQTWPPADPKHGLQGGKGKKIKDSVVFFCKIGDLTDVTRDTLSKVKKEV